MPLPAFFTSEKVVAGTMSESFVVASCAASFGVFTHEPAERLEAAGCVVKVNPLGRAMKDLEMIKFAADADADAIILGNAELSGRVIRALPKLKLIARHGTGIDGIAYAEARSRGIVITNAPGTNSEETAGLTFGIILDLERNISLMNAELKSGIWK